MNLLRLWIGVVICWCGTFSQCRSQGTFEHLTTNDGLSHSTVMDILQDHRGFIWLATADGLNRYDGERFSTYRRSSRDSNTLSNNYIKCLLEDDQRQLWIGTNAGGVNVLDKSGERAFRLTQCVDGSDISSVTINDFAKDNAGFVWAATGSNGLLKINPVTREVWQITTANSGLATNLVRQICFDQENNLWIGNQNGILQRLRPGQRKSTLFTLPARVPGAPGGIMTISCDTKGRLWVGTQGKGLFRFNRNEGTFQSVFYRPGVVEGVNNARSLYEDADGRLWLGTDDGIVVAEDPAFRATRHLRHNPAESGSLSTHATVCLRGDRQGNIWVGTWEAGLNVLFKRPAPFQAFTYQPGQSGSLLTKAVSAIAANPTGGVWVGSTQGLSLLDPARSIYRHFLHEPGNPHTLPGKDITQLHPLSEDVLLVTLWNKGTVLVDPKTGRLIRRLDPLGRSAIIVIAGDTGRSVRVYTEGGGSWTIDRFSGRIEPGSVLPRDLSLLTVALETADGTLWIGTPADGLMEISEGGKKTRYHQPLRTPGALYSEHITALFEDRARQLWVGTMSGLHRYDRLTREFTLIDRENGLTNDAIMSIGQDKEGFLWVGTNDGLCRLNMTGRVLGTYRRADGLAGNDFTNKAITQSADGTLYWGGKHGVTAYRRSETEKLHPPVPVYLTDLRLFNRVIQPGEADSPLKQALLDTKTLLLRYEQSVFTFDFAAVLFRAHRNVRYAYKLDGFETDWNFVGPQHSATYTNQNPGSYRFRVKASLTDNFVNAPETVLDVIILPPWYRTGWAYTAYALIVVLLLAALRRLIQIRENYKTKLRVEHLETEKARELDRIRTGFFTNISHEFRTPLTLIVTPLEQFMSDPAVNSWRGQFQTMHRNASRLLRLINQLLDLSKLESGSLSPEISQQDVLGFVRQVAQSFQPQAVKQGIELSIDTETEGPPVWFDQDILEKTLYNLIANALKFTPIGGAITVRCRLIQPKGGTAGEAELLVLEVEDTGIGISPEHALHIFERFYQVEGKNQAKKAGSGIGLALTRELVEIHRGRIRVESQREAGTAFVVELPVYAAAFPPDWLSGRADGMTQIMKNPADEGDSSHTELVSTKVALGRDSIPLVLVVEDHDDLRQYLAQCLGKNYRVHTATNGREALAFAQAQIPDLVVSDWMMPDMDGLELCGALKTDERTSHVPVLMLTSRSSNESKVEGLDAGADDYVTKPFNLEILLSRVRNLIQSRRLLREKYSRVLTQEPGAVSTESVEEAFLRKALTLIENRLSDPELDVSLLERELGLSNTQLYRKLKALTGKGGNEFIRHVRLQRAAHLLKAGDRQVAEVAYDVGFNDPNYFNRVFRKEFGMSPGEWGKMEHEI